MGYRSDLIIGIHKIIIARDLISREIPDSLRKVKYVMHNDVAYYRINSWKWYPSYPEVATMEAYFDKLTDEQDTLPEDSEIHVLFGAMRIGEDDNDFQEWGDPYSLDIALNRTIDYPAEAMDALE